MDDATYKVLKLFSERIQEEKSKEWFLKCPETLDLYRGTDIEEYNNIITGKTSPGKWWSPSIRTALFYAIVTKSSYDRGIIIMRDCSKNLIEWSNVFNNELTIFQERVPDTIFEFIPTCEILSLIENKWNIISLECNEKKCNLSRQYPSFIQKRIVPGYNAVVEQVKQWAVSRWNLGENHGLSHWERVERNGLQLATPNCDLTVIRLFAYLHDSCRKTDSIDIKHGPRAAKMMEDLRDTLLEDLSDEQFLLLQKACCLHTMTHSTGNPTIDACFDADRLDLCRMGIIPNPQKMATEKGKEMAGFYQNRGKV